MWRLSRVTDFFFLTPQILWHQSINPLNTWQRHRWCEGKQVATCSMMSVGWVLDLIFQQHKVKSTTCTSLSQPRTIKLAAKWWTQLSMSERKSQVCPSRVAGDQQRAKSQWHWIPNVRLDLVLLPPCGQINQLMQLSFSFSCNSLCSLLLMPLFSHWAVLQFILINCLMSLENTLHIIPSQPFNMNMFNRDYTEVMNNQDNTCGEQKDHLHEYI